MNTNVEDTPLLNVVDFHNTRRTLWPFSSWTPVELLVILNTVAVMVLQPVQTYYILDETAKRHGQSHITRHSDQSCHSLNTSDTSNISDSSVIIQKEATDTLLYLGLCDKLGSVLPIFIIGYLSDYLGRRVVWIISVCGTIFKEVILMVTILLRLPIWVLYIGQTVFALTGTYTGSLVAIFATIADVTVPGEKRAFRITLVQCTGMLTSAATTYVMGYWVWTENYSEPIILSLCVSVLSIVLSIFILKSHAAPGSQRTDILSPLKLYFRTRDQNKRRKLFLSLLIFLLSSSCLMGKLEYQTLFLMHQPVCWNELDVQIMHAVQTLVNTVCVVVVVRLFLRYAQDIAIVVLGSISGIISMIILGLSVNSAMVYLHVCFGFISIAVFPVLRAIMSRLVEPGEQGSLFASIGCLDELISSVSGVAYGKLYGWSIGWNGGLIFLLMAGVFCVILGCSVILYTWLKSDSRA